MKEKPSVEDHMLGENPPTPVLPDPCVDRGNILDTIDQVFEGESDVMVIEGREGHGKTVTATLYALRHRGSAITLFLRGGSRWAYDPEMARHELCQQLAGALGKTLPDDGTPSDAAYRSLLIGLRRLVKGNPRSVYVVVDGLSEIPSVDAHIAQQLWELLPIDTPGLKFLITWDSQAGIEIPFPKKTKNMVLPVFGIEESVKLLDGVGVSRSDAEQLHRTCRGQPGWL